MSDRPTMFNMDGTPVTPEHQAAYEAELLESLRNIFKEDDKSENC